jgi:hypothetical protein
MGAPLAVLELQQPGEEKKSGGCRQEWEGRILNRLCLLIQRLFVG